MVTIKWEFISHISLRMLIKKYLIRGLQMKYYQIQILLSALSLLFSEEALKHQVNDETDKWRANA